MGGWWWRGAVWSALIVGGWMVVAWSRNSCFVFLVLFENGEPSVSPRFHLVSDINQGNEDAL